MSRDPVGDFLIIGFGIVGSGVHHHLKGRIVVLDKHPVRIADRPGQRTTSLVVKVHENNYAELLERHTRAGSVVIETATHIGTRDLASWCNANGRHFINTVADIWLADLLDWSDGYRRIDGLIYRLMEPMFELVESAGSGATSVVMQGANTGMVNHYLKQAIADKAGASGRTAAEIGRAVREVYILEKDTLCFRPGFRPQPDVFYNTWNIEEFILESAALCEFPQNGARIVHQRPLQRDVVLDEVALKGRLVPHEETFTMAYYLATAYGNRDVKVQFLYEASPIGVFSRMRYAFGHPYVERAVIDEIDPDLGYDLVGTLIVLDDGSNWFTGQRMDNHVARRFFAATNATAWFVSAGVLAAVDWVRSAPRAGILLPEFADHRAIIERFAQWSSPTGYVSKPMQHLFLSDEYPDIAVENLYATGERIIEREFVSGSSQPVGSALRA